jgi:hypothetical protein
MTIDFIVGFLFGFVVMGLLFMVAIWLDYKLKLGVKT